MRSRPLSLALGLLVSGCGDIAGFDGNPQMRPGQDCLGCHSASGQASNLTFSVGGTVYPAALAGTEGGLFDAEIDIIDYNGRSFTLHSNGAGNFYSAEPIVFPATVSITVGGQVFAMQNRPPMGSCNACHAVLTNPDGTLWPQPLPGSLEDAGFLVGPPGHLYAFPPPPPTVCPGAGSVSCPSPAPSFSNQVESIVEANCFLCHPAAIPNCCPTGTQCGDARLPCPQDPPLDPSYQDIKAASQKSLSWLNNCGMPPVDDSNHPWFPMSPDEREILIAWINCGSKSN